MKVKSIEYRNQTVYLLDQTLLPHETRVLELRHVSQVVEAISSLRIRGAPAIGVAGAYALVLAANEIDAAAIEQFRQALRAEAETIANTRPTAVNLAWAVQRLLHAVEGVGTPDEARALLLKEAHAIQREDEEANRLIGLQGAPLVPPGCAVLTHCNTGALATTAFGTALGVVRTAWQQGRLREVFATETRPVLQGARLTAWELVEEGIAATLIADSAAGVLMAQGGIGCVVVGADRIAANGDVANKIGTYTLAVLAKEHHIPFYVAAPTSTIDLDLPSGEAIPIEERPSWEITHVNGHRIAPEAVHVYNPAFDVTPARLVTAIVTESGVARPPYAVTLPNCLSKRSQYASTV